MSQVSIILTDKEDGTLSVQIIADQDEGKSHQVAMLFMEWLQNLDKPQIVTHL